MTSAIDDWSDGAKKRNGRKSKPRHEQIRARRAAMASERDKDVVERLASKPKRTKKEAAALEEVKQDLYINEDATTDLLRELRFMFPASFFLPNIGQEKAISPLKTYSGGISIGAFFGGNGVGKTTDLCILTVGLSCGKNQLHRFFDDWEVFDWADRIRSELRRPLKIRLICHKNGMMDDGGLYQEMMKWAPKGWFNWSKQQHSYFVSCEVRNPEDPGTLLATIQVRTFDQDRVAHAGDTMDVILSDEPFPKSLWSENVGRIRAGGIIWIFCTPLEVGGWLKDQLHGRADVHFTQASIWDNCIDWHPDPGLVGKTRGHLKRKDIERQLKEWELEGIEVRKARELGEFTHLAGQILKEWNDSAHICEPFQIPKNWPIYRVMDPSNGGKPDFVSWWAQSPEDRFYCIAEYPGDKWTEACKKPGPSVKAACEALRQVEEPFRSQIQDGYSFADPALWKFQSRTGNQVVGISNALAFEFSREGFRFAEANNDTKVGMTKLRELLQFDPLLPVEGANRPHMMVFRYNYWTGKPLVNMMTAPGQWCFKKSAIGGGNEKSFTATVEEEWKDPIDTMRYLATKWKPFAPVRLKEEIEQSRDSSKVNRSTRW